MEQHSANGGGNDSMDVAMLTGISLRAVRMIVSYFARLLRSENVMGESSSNAPGIHLHMPHEEPHPTSYTGRQYVEALGIRHRPRIVLAYCVGAALLLLATAGTFVLYQFGRQLGP